MRYFVQSRYSATPLTSLRTPSSPQSLLSPTEAEAALNSSSRVVHSPLGRTGRGKEAEDEEEEAPEKEKSSF